LNRPPIRLLRGELTSAELPERIDLGELNAAMNELWERSIRDIDRGRVVECGGTLVLSQEGTLELINPVAGDADGISLSHSAPSDMFFVGTFHTHPYEDGRTGMAFSGADMAMAINHGSILTLVQSGEWVFGLVRTEKTPERVDWFQLNDEMAQLYESYLEHPGLSSAEALFLANLEMCARYGLAFYYGEVFGALEEVYRP